MPRYKIGTTFSFSDCPITCKNVGAGLVPAQNFPKPSGDHKSRPYKICSRTVWRLGGVDKLIKEGRSNLRNIFRLGAFFGS